MWAFVLAACVFLGFFLTFALKHIREIKRFTKLAVNATDILWTIEFYQLIGNKTYVLCISSCANLNVSSKRKHKKRSFSTGKVFYFHLESMKNLITKKVHIFFELAQYLQLWTFFFKSNFQRIQTFLRQIIKLHHFIYLIFNRGAKF